MNEQTPYQELKADLAERWSDVAVRIETLENRVEQGLSSGQPNAADVRELVRYSRLMRGHLAELESHAGELLDELENDPHFGAHRDTGPSEACQTDAALEIERDMHRPSRSFKEVLKAVFMWRDTPEERLKQRQEDESRMGD